MWQCTKSESDEPKLKLRDRQKVHSVVQSFLFNVSVSDLHHCTDHDLTCPIAIMVVIVIPHMLESQFLSLNTLGIVLSTWDSASTSTDHVSDSLSHCSILYPITTMSISDLKCH